jgi:hypothetical protein
MQDLKHVLRSHYPRRASLIYVREAFEPSDPECRPPSLMKSPTVDVTTITKEQIDRLRFVIVDEPFREIMISSLGYYECLHYTNVAFQVVDDFSRFKSKYSLIKESREKFIKLFCFTFILQRFDSWMRRIDRGRWGRQRMVLRNGGRTFYIIGPLRNSGSTPSSHTQQSSPCCSASNERLKALQLMVTHQCSSSMDNPSHHHDVDIDKTGNRLNKIQNNQLKESFAHRKF